MSQTSKATGWIAEAGSGHRTGHRHLEMSAGEILFDALENEFVFCNRDSRSFGQRHRHHDALIVHESAVAAAEIDYLILITIVTTEERVLARDERAAAQANGVVARAPDRGGVADGEFERLARERRDAKFGGHGEAGSIW